MTFKLFAERFNKELDNIGVPSHDLERISVVAKLLKIQRFKADALIHGLVLPDHELLTQLAAELEVNPDWLLGKSDTRTVK